MDSATVSELSEYISGRFNVLNTALKLRAGAGGDAEELEEMKANLIAVQQVVKTMHDIVEDERHAITQANTVLLAVREERARIEHVLANMPERLPSAAPPQPQGHPLPSDTTAAPAATASRDVGGGRRRPAPCLGPLTVEEYATVPQYMRGRVTRDQANRLLDEVNAVLQARHELVSQPRGRVAAKEKQLWNACKREETAELKGQAFITEADFQRFGRAPPTKTQRQLLVILRHCGRTRMVRGPATTIRHVAN